MSIENEHLEAYGGQVTSKSGRGSELIESLIEQARKLSDMDTTALEGLRVRAAMVIRTVFGQASPYLDDLQRTQRAFFPSSYGGPKDYREKQRTQWPGARSRLISLFETMAEDLELSSQQSAKAEDAEEELSPRVFVVHGHDQGMKQSVARTLERLGLEPVILHERPNRGRTIIEKLTDYSEPASVSYAVVLLSPDDLGYERDASPESAKPRARQNVVLELGLLLGKLGRQGVAVIHSGDEQFEIPSDYRGVLYIPYDDGGSWRFQLAKELKARGYDVDADKLLD